MNQISVTDAVLRENMAQKRSASRTSWLNSIIAWLLIAIIALAPIPFGSARALYWEALAVLVGSIAVIYFATAIVMREVPRISLVSIAPQALAFAVLCLWLLIQTVPLIPMSIGLPDGTTLSNPTISIAPGMTFLMLLRQLTYGLFFLLVMQTCANQQRRRMLTEVILWCIVAYGIYGMTSLYSGDTILGMEKWAYRGYVTGTFVNRNSFATFLAMGGVIAAARIGKVVAAAAEKHAGDGRVENYISNLWIYGLAYSFLVIVVLMTGSRMGLFMIATGAGVALSLSMRRTRIAYISLFAPIAITIAIGAIILFGEGLLERLDSLEDSVGIRGELYQQIWRLILQRPYTGFGGGAFELAFPLVHSLPVNPDLVWHKAHNTYLALWSELGLVMGSVPMVALFLCGLRMALAIFRKRSNLESQTIGIGVLVVGGLHSIVDFSLEIPANTFVFLALVAAGTAATINTRMSGK